jgi:preprotein translocase subunit SecE
MGYLADQPYPYVIFGSRCRWRQCLRRANRFAPFEDSSMNGTSPMEFLREIRQELAKVTWPTRKETAVTTGMVFVMVFLLAIFFLGVDQLISLAIQTILGLGS